MGRYCVHRTKEKKCNHPQYKPITIFGKKVFNGCKLNNTQDASQCSLFEHIPRPKASWEVSEVPCTYCGSLKITNQKCKGCGVE